MKPAAIPAMVSTRDSRTTSRARVAVHDANVPVVCTSGASGPIPPPDAMHSHEIGISERNMRTPVAVPDTWMLSTMSSTSPGLPTNRVIEGGEHADPAQDREADDAAPLRRPEHVLEQVEHEEVQRADDRRKRARR